MTGTEFDFNKPISLLTWLDVERRLREITQGFFHFPEYIVSIDCYAEGAEIMLTDSKHEAELHDWLAKHFGNSLNEQENILSLSIGNVEYPFETIIDLGIKPKYPARYPLWHDLAYFKADDPKGFTQPDKSLDTRRISAFHSFKGGVGRTTALMTHLAAYLEQTKKLNTHVLLIDADLEAPGITYWLDIANQPSISFVRFLEAVHYPPSSVEESIQYCADELRKSSLTLNGTHEVFILPACVDPDEPIELLDTPVLPEHLARNTKNPWCVGDAIFQLADRLDAGLVLIDLRAGLSELASPLLFDPRIEKFIVSTVAKQSVNGAALVLGKMALLSSLTTDTENPAAVPTVILSLLTPQLRESVDYEEAIQRMNAAFPSPQTSDGISSGIEFVEAGFDSNLMCIRDFKQALELVRNSPLFIQAKQWAESFQAASSIKATAFKTPTKTPKTPKISGRDNEAKKLEAVCQRYIYAEKGEGENLLVTEPLRNLAKHYEKSIPQTISIGAKGAGKTFNFLQLCRQKTWEHFLNKLNFDFVNTNGKETLIFPLLSSKSLEKDAKEIVALCRENCFKQLGIANSFSEIELNDRIEEAEKQGDIYWTKFWVKELLSAFSIDGNDLKDLSQFLTLKKIRLIILIDGLEDQFTTPSENIEQKSALEALLRLPDRIGEIREGNLGIIEFVRSDYVRTVIQQNSGQFEAKYKPFALEWTAESFLRLAYWICAETGLGWASLEDSEKLSSPELLENLQFLWGQKLGSPTSKEAHTARWIFAALCDLNGRLQARDLVRFLYHAARKRQTGRSIKWEDRILPPEAIRRAVEDCSSDKVQEAITEIDVLKRWNTNLAQIDSSYKTVPFNASSVGLNADMSKALQELGVVFEDKKKEAEDRFYLPESYRTGLGFQLTATARPKVLALIQRNSVKLPF